jgi:hypothetical protein
MLTVGTSQLRNSRRTKNPDEEKIILSNRKSGKFELLACGASRGIMLEQILWLTFSWMAAKTEIEQGS